MKVIDYALKGNVVRFYLGLNEDNDYYGDDWDDVPYEHNAGSVYQKYIKGYIDIAFGWDWSVYTPADNYYWNGNSNLCKNDFKSGKIPCLYITKDPDFWWNMHEFEDGHEICSPAYIPIFFGQSGTFLRELISGNSDTMSLLAWSEWK